MGLVGPWVVPEYAADFPEVAAATEYVPLPALGETPDFVADSGWGLTVSTDSPAAERRVGLRRVRHARRRERRGVEPRDRDAPGAEENGEGAGRRS